MDEIDAPLHPSMSRRLVETIVRTLVAEENIHVIMTTHSPSTIAVSHEDAVFVMRPDVCGVQKSTKTAALALLTSDIPTLSISFDGRRQVFVESDTDADLFGLLYQSLRSRIASERSLVFIGAGRRPATGSDQNAGCEQVKSVVNKLVEGGNASVFGLIDWDGFRTPQDRIHVLGFGERYSIENCLLDPLLVAVVAIREDTVNGPSRLGMETGETFVSLLAQSCTRLQMVADRVQRCVLELGADADLGPHQEVRYCGDFTLNVSKTYLLMNGHSLEEAVKRAFPWLRRFHKPDSLLRHVVCSVSSEAPRFVPAVVRDCLTKLLATEIG